jgi:phage terminase large subunit GpA-like protein
MLPSEWAEKHRVMPQKSPFPGPYSYDRTPYFREIVNHLSPESPARIIALMKGAQLGASAGVIENGLGWIIDQKPVDVLFLTGHIDLAEESMSGRIDEMIDSCGLRPLIGPNTLRKKNQRTGDTNQAKEFPGGSIIAGSAGNHKLLRQRTVQVGFIDDYEAAKGLSKESGSTEEMIEQRFASSESKMKLFFISTPETKHNSNIEPVYLLGDQRRYNVHCPCCQQLIPLEWQFETGSGLAGITWKTDERGRLFESSVGYICQLCSGFFDEKNKYELNYNGLWVPTADPFAPGYVSYQISSLYAAPGMFGWTKYVYQYLKACPPNGQINTKKLHTFTNLVLGLTYEEKSKEVNANLLRNNHREYPIGTIPEKLSIKDGNGKIIALTLACDLGGVEDDKGGDDVRLDWELVAWSESGTPYSIDQGSIGTFIPKENSIKHKQDRIRWSYNLRSSRSVWPVLRQIATKAYEKDTGTKMKPMIVGIDTGFFEKNAFDFIDSVKDFWCVGLKGKDVFKYTRINKETAVFRPAVSRNKLYLVEVNKVKDQLADLMQLTWDPAQDDDQPVGFMNYPQQSDGKYSYPRYFAHFEAEHRILEQDPNDKLDLKYKWVKKKSSLQNHFWDVRIYNMALRDILAYEVCRIRKIPHPTWVDYVRLVNGEI